MARKARYNIPVPTWTCPHCGFVHTPADLLRLDAHRTGMQELRQAVAKCSGHALRISNRTSTSLFPEMAISAMAGLPPVRSVECVHAIKDTSVSNCDQTP